MKYLLCIFLGLLLMVYPVKSKAQSFEITQLILDIEKLAQLKNILSDLYKSYQILSDGYEAIKNLSQGNFNLHQAFLDGLLGVSPVVKNYKRAADIIENQVRIISEYKSAYSRFSRDKNFNPDEITYLSQVYNNLVSETAKNLENLLNVITADKLRMSDDQRLHAIDGIYESSKDQLMFLRHFNNSTTVLAVQRAVEHNDTQTLKALYNLN
jgi:DNA repair ATPase RecN